LGMVGGQYISRFIEEIKSWKKYLDSGYRLALYAGLMIIGAVFTCWKFVINFEQIAQGVTFVNANSTWWELLTLWGWDLFMGLSLLGLIGYKILKGKVVLLVDWLMVSWWLMGVLLIILPELIYVKDIYISDYHRANTMFKLVYQSWTMFAFVGAYTVVRWWHEIREKMLPIKVWLPWFVFSALGIAVMMPYPAKAIDSFYGRFRLNEESNLNGTDWLRVMSPSEANVMDWLNTLPDQPAILESVGESYTEFNRFSAYTGLPTIEGWTVHEWLWRGGYPQERISEVELVYTANSIDETRMLTVDDTDAQLDPLTNSLPKKTVTIGDVRKILDKYNIKYIIVGDKEREKYPNLNEALIASLGKIVFQSGDSRVYEVMSQ